MAGAGQALLPERLSSSGAYYVCRVRYEGSEYLSTVTAAGANDGSQQKRENFDEVILTGIVVFFVQKSFPAVL